MNMAGLRSCNGMKLKKSRESLDGGKEHVVCSLVIRGKKWESEKLPHLGESVRGGWMGPKKNEGGQGKQRENGVLTSALGEGGRGKLAKAVKRSAGDPGQMPGKRERPVVAKKRAL